MIMSNFLKNRKSIREFKKKEVDIETLDNIRSRLMEISKEKENIKFKLYEKGELIHSNLQGKAGYAGVMIDAPHYIALEWERDDEKSIIYGSYYMEELITELNNMELDTCWVSIPDVDRELKEKVLGESVDKIDYLLAFGYEKSGNPFNPESTSERSSVADIVFDGQIERAIEMEDLRSKGLLDIFYYIRYAPSTKNLQPWRFLLKDDRVQLLLAYEEWEEHFLIDAGIIMYYFEKMAEYQGMKNSWELIHEGNYEGEYYNYRLIGEYRL